MWRANRLLFLAGLLGVASAEAGKETPSELKPWPGADGNAKERLPAPQPPEPQEPDADKKPPRKPDRKPDPKPAPPKVNKKDPAVSEDPCGCDKFLREGLKACDEDPDCGTPERTRIYEAAGSCRGQCPS